MRTALGGSLYPAGRGADALTEHQAVLREHPDDPGARIGVGLLLLHEEKWQAAIDQLEKVRPDVPEDARVLAGIGTAYAAMGNCEKAIDPLRLALDLTPDDYRAGEKGRVVRCEVEEVERGAGGVADGDARGIAR